MNKLSICAALSILSNNSYSDVKSLSKKLSSIGVKVSYIKELDESINACDIDNNLLLSIIMVESSFKVDTFNKYSNDYGLMQINEYHVKRMKLDKYKLLNSPKYNIEIGCKVLSYFIKRYPRSEAIARYNVGTGKNRHKTSYGRKYLKNVLYWYKKLLK